MDEGSDDDDAKAAAAGDAEKMLSTIPVRGPDVVDMGGLVTPAGG